jgi:cell shape-determining protein MreC
MASQTARSVLIAVLVGAAMMLLLDIRGAGPGQTIRGAAGALAGPPTRAVAWVRTEAAARFGGAADEQARIAQLEQELADARTELGERATTQADAAAAAAMARALPLAGYGLVAGRVVARAAPQDLTGAVTIGVGSDRGITPGMVVIDAGGAVGLVAAVSPATATLRLVTDAGTRLAVRVAGSHESAILRGAGTEPATLTLLDPLGAMSVGDQVITIGTADRLVPADLPLGVITAIAGSAADLSRHAEVDLRVDASTLDRLAVLVPRELP